MPNLQCTCGETRLEVSGEPFMVTECLCDSCRQAADRLQKLEGTPAILTDYGATRCCEYRKDRVRIVSGQENLREFRLNADAGTRRVISTCCNTPVFMEMKGGHWVSLYSQLWPGGQTPPVNYRTMTADLSDPSVLPDDGVPSLKHHSLSFYAKIFGAWVAMGFRDPQIEVKGKVDA